MLKEVDSSFSAVSSTLLCKHKINLCCVLGMPKLKIEFELLRSVFVRITTRREAASLQELSQWYMVCAQTKFRPPLTFEHHHLPTSNSDVQELSDL